MPGSLVFGHTGACGVILQLPDLLVPRSALASERTVEALAALGYMRRLKIGKPVASM
jgi:hypothetical protein